MEDTPYLEEEPQLQAPLSADNSGLPKLTLVVLAVIGLGHKRALVVDAFRGPFTVSSNPQPKKVSGNRANT